MTVLQNAVRVLAAGCTCTFLMGCEIDNTKEHSNEPAETSSTADTSDKDNTAVNPVPNPAVNPTLPSSPMGIPAGGQVAGNSSEGNGETDNFGNGNIWVDGSSRFGIRCLANDNKVDGTPPEYYCDSMVSAKGALKMYVWPDNSVIAVASDFQSQRSGLVYKFVGFVPNSTSSGLITENPHILSKSEQGGTFRVFWNTHAAQ